MSQTVTENLFNHDVSITTTGGVELTVDLSATPWNRTTIADGWWLQNRTNSAFSARDIYLANRIDEINDNIANIHGGYINSLMSMNNVIYSANDYWNGLPPTIAPSNTSKPAPSNTLTYMTVGEDTDLGTEDISLINDRTCIIQGNLTENSFNQILMNTNGLFYRSVSGDTVNSVTGEKIDNYDLLETDTQFSQILDDSTINTPGYWFLHKETSGRPVWTNINALAEYIDNRVNPDGVYIDWSATNILGYDTRILTILPPTETNINSGIDVTGIAYNNNAYLWSDGGWVECPPLMSRTEIEELVFSGGNLPPYDESNAGQVLTVNNDGDGLEWTNGGGGASIKDFLSLFTAHGAQAHYTNFGPWLQSEVNTDGRAYYETENSPDSAYYIDSDVTNTATPNKLPAFPRSSAYTYGAPRFIRTIVGTDDNETAMWDNCKANITAHLANGSTTSAEVYNRALFTTCTTAESNAPASTYPIYIRLAPFTYLNEEREYQDPTLLVHYKKFNNVSRKWNIHFCVNGLGIFAPSANQSISQDASKNLPIAAQVNVSIGLFNCNQDCNSIEQDGTTPTYFTQEKTYYINEGDCVYNPSALSANRGWIGSDGDDVALKEGVVMINKEIDYSEVFDACIINNTPNYGYDSWRPWLRVCVKGIYPVKGLPTPGTTVRNIDFRRLGIEIMGNTGYDPINNLIPGSERFIEEFTDDRFMDMAYRYVNDLPTRRLSYTNGNQDNLLGVNAINPTLTNNTHVLGA